MDNLKREICYVKMKRFINCIYEYQIWPTKHIIQACLMFIWGHGYWDGWLIYTPMPLLVRGRNETEDLRQLWRILIDGDLTK